MTPITEEAERTRDDREASESLKHRYILIVCALLFLIITSALILQNSRSVSPKTDSMTAARSSSNGQAIRLSGTTEAIRMRTIVVPTLEGQQFGNLTITRLAPSGARVHKGDVLVEFDRQAQLRDLVDKQDEYQKLATQTVQEQSKEEAARAKDQTELQQAESDLRKAELEIQKLELLSRIDAEKAQQTLDEAKANVSQLRTTFDAKRKSAHAAVRLLELQRDREGQIVEHTRSNTELMQIKSDIDGVVVLNTIWKQGRMGEVEEGDQLRAGTNFMQVVDPSSMQVRALVNQEDFLSLHFGDNSQVRLDAYPELVFSGKLIEMAPIARAGDFSAKLRAFAVVFSINGSDPKLMPDLSAAVDVSLSTQVSGAGAFH